ncbi:MAG: DUF4440 domain-containing protein [Planctomycetes bacterium]|nr:DUF4440 domain-containing protein [Planctomycetota bacterium]
MILPLLIAFGCRAPERSDFAAILERQAAAWNRGDIDEFMQDYWKSENLTFSSGGKTQRGWEGTRDRYQQRYATPEQMGTLRFSIDEMQPLGRDAALVLGQWDLSRTSGDVGGNFSLVFRRIEGRWVIAHDHTSTR